MTDDKTASHVTGIGGFFFKAAYPDRLRAWYAEHLGLESAPGDSSVVLSSRATFAPTRIEQTVWNPFAASTTYFEPSESSWMLNLRVRDLDGLLASLEDDGVELVGDVEEYEFGRFAWALDPEGNKIELWEPPAGNAAFGSSVPRFETPADLCLAARPTLGVRDLDASVGWYDAVLGFSTVAATNEPEPFALLARDGVQLALVQTASPAVAPFAAVYVEVTDVELALERAKEAGSEPVIPLTEHPWGMTDFVVPDPDGHRLAVGERTGSDG